MAHACRFCDDRGDGDHSDQASTPRADHVAECSTVEDFLGGYKMKRVIRNGFAIVVIILSSISTIQIVSGQLTPIKPEQNMRSIERPNPTWDYDGKRILGHVGQIVILWDATTGKVLQKLQGHKERISSVRFSPDGVHALSSSWMGPGGMKMYKSQDTRTIFWNLATGEQKGVFPEQVAGEFSPDGKRIVTFSARPDQLGWFDAIVWDVTNGRQLAKVKLDDASRPQPGNGLGDALHFAPGGSSFAHIKGGAWKLYNSCEGVLYDASDGREIGRTPRLNGGHRYTSSGMLVSLDSEKANFADLKSGKVQSIPHGLKFVNVQPIKDKELVKFFQAAAWTHDGKRVAALPYGGGEIKIWDVESGKATAGVKCHPVTLGVAIVSPDNGRLAIESGSNPEDHPELRLYDLKTGKEIERIKLAQWGHVIGFSPDSKTILVGGREFVIYDSENGKEIRRLKLLDDVSFSHDWNK
jgi:WD40 repeat protein